MFLSVLRKPVDRFLPSVGCLYRSLHDLRVADARQTIYGFKLAGNPHFASSDFEPNEARTFLELLESHDTVLDVGANIGFYSCLAASRGKHVIAFEPLPRNLQFLYRNLWENGLHNTEVFPLGLAKEPGLRRLYGTCDTASFVTGWAQAERNLSAVVPVTSLDRIVATRFQGQKLLIKLDVVGIRTRRACWSGKYVGLNAKADLARRDSLGPQGNSGRD
jgi:FkbM family methyltransferase